MAYKIKDSLLLGMSLITFVMGMLQYNGEGKITPDIRSLIHDSVICLIAVGKVKKNDRSGSDSEAQK